MNFGRPTPTLWSFGEARNKAFCLDFPGFDLQFEHRFDAGLPFYMGVARSDRELRIPVDTVDAFVAALTTDHGNARPGLPESTPWQTRKIAILDPSGNRLTFYTDMTHGAHD